MNRYPYHRYLTYQVLNGDSVAEIRQHMSDLEYLPPDDDDVEELRKVIGPRIVTAELRQRMGVAFFDEKSPSIDAMHWLVETAAARSCAERLLLDRVEPAKIATILSLRFNRELTTKAIELFRDGFWDTATLTPVDFAVYFRRAGSVKPDPPPQAVSLSHRPLYSAWEQGVPPSAEELPVEEMVRQVSVDAFMNFKRLASRDTPDAQNQAMKFAALLLRAAPAASRAGPGGKNGQSTVPGLQPLVEYPPDTTMTITQLHQQYAEATSGTGGDVAAMGLDDDA